MIEPEDDGEIETVPDDDPMEKLDDEIEEL